MRYAQFIQNEFYLIRESFHPIQIYLWALGGNMLICRKGQDHSDINLHVLALFWYLVSSSKYSQWSGEELSKHWKNCESCPAQKVFMIEVFQIPLFTLGADLYLYIALSHHYQGGISARLPPPSANWMAGQWIMKDRRWTNLVNKKIIEMSNWLERYLI